MSARMFAGGVMLLAPGEGRPLGRPKFANVALPSGARPVEPSAGCEMTSTRSTNDPFCPISASQLASPLILNGSSPALPGVAVEPLPSMRRKEAGAMKLSAGSVRSAG